MKALVFFQCVKGDLNTFVIVTVNLVVLHNISAFILFNNDLCTYSTYPSLFSSELALFAFLPQNEIP